MRRQEESPQARDESGAVLLLAMIFILVIGLAVGALAAWSGNDIRNIGKFKETRSTLNAGAGATQAQMTAMRFVYATTCPGTSYTLDGASVVVTCTATVSPASSASRVINFTASPQGQSNRILIAAQVTYNDFSSGFNKNDCLPSTPSPTTCGSGMTVNSWVINPGVS